MKSGWQPAEQDLLITFHDTGEHSAREAANKLSAALNCKVVTFKEGQLDQVSTPATQTRVAFHGDGNSQIFGSTKHYLSPIEFANELIKFLKNNPNVTDVDLLSCNLGLIDKNNNCYALSVQECLDANGYGHVNVNTFVADNKDDAILDSFFIVGLKNDPNSQTLGENLFSLDVLKKDNAKQAEMSKRLEGLENDQFDLQVQRDLLASIKELLAGKSANVTLANLRTRLQDKDYNQGQITHILTKYNVQIYDQEDDLYVTTNLFPQKQYRYKKDVQTDMDAVDVKISKTSKDMEELANNFAKLRTAEASTTRIHKDEISQVRKYLKPMRHLISDQLMNRVTTLKTPNQNFDAKTIGALIKNISDTYKGRRLHGDLRKLDIYAGNLADIFSTYKNNNTKELNVLNELAFFLGNAYQNCITEGKDVEECINELRIKVKEICFDVKTNYKEQDSPRQQNFSGGGLTTFASSSLSQKLNEAIIKSDQAMAALSTQFRKEPAPAH